MNNAAIEGIYQKRTVLREQYARLNHLGISILRWVHRAMKKCQNSVLIQAGEQQKWSRKRANRNFVRPGSAQEHNS